ncbi:MAG TPA: PEP-CTERM sorting domain-containing protein [Lacipirellulaceae bacterium]|nr:PEP-CTERM sorting domain-containing protein [Lacipirellulaceae bacterium]
MLIKNFRIVLCASIVASWASAASAVVLYSDNFNTAADSANWTVNSAPAANASIQHADFGFDYSVDGIPAAPGSADTLGMRLRANTPLDGGGNDQNTRPAGATSGLSVSPTGKSFGTNYQVTFYAWSNFAGAANASGLGDNASSEGGTNNILFALGTSGTVPQVVGNTSALTDSTIDGIAFATTGDGGITNDFRTYPKTNAIGPTSQLAAGAYSNQTALYTTLFPAVAAPAVQSGIASSFYTSPTGTGDPMGGVTQTGSFGFAWHKVVLTKNNGSVTWTVDDTLLATVDASALTLGGNNIALGVSDVNSTTARYPNLTFTVFDNLSVSSLVAPGVPADYNGNGVVDMADYVLWRNGGPLQNEVNTVGTVDASDYDAWRAAFGNHAGSGSGLGNAAVPEPASLFLLAVGFAAVCLRRIR